MDLTKRQKQIIEILEQRNFTSIGDLCRDLSVSEMTVWRDLKKLSEENIIIRTFGGALPNRSAGKQLEGSSILNRSSQEQPGSEDVLIVASVYPDQKLPFLPVDRVTRPMIIAEGSLYPNAVCTVGIDNYQAGYDLGCWVGEYAIRCWEGIANVLLWSHDLPNTEARSNGFLSGLDSTIPKLGEVVTLKPIWRDDIAYQLTRDALEVNNKINVIFTINENNAWGAIRACKDLGIDPEKMIVVPFGLEGDTIKNALISNYYCPVCLAMFPEIVGRTLIDTAFAAYNGEELPAKIETPYKILTRETLMDFYQNTDNGWVLRWDSVAKKLGFAGLNPGRTISGDGHYPGSIGFYVSFPQHEWYQNMVAAMKEYSGSFGCSIDILDVDQSRKVKLEQANRRIAKRAALEIKSGDTIFISGDAVTDILTEIIDDDTEVTVITNATSIFNRLEGKKNITLLSTGGILRRESQALVGPIAEKTLNDIRVDKLFLAVSGISLKFGLSNISISEVTIKQAMIKSAREVILLADHTKFEQESFIQIAPIQVVDKLITDNDVPASIRLQFNAIGIEVIIS